MLSILLLEGSCWVKAVFKLARHVSQRFGHRLCGVITSFVGGKWWFVGFLYTVVCRVPFLMCIVGPRKLISM